MEQQGFLFSDAEPTPEQPKPEPTAKRAEKPAPPTQPQPAQRVSVDGQVEQLVTLKVYGKDVTIGWARRVGNRWAAVYISPDTHRQHKISGTFTGAHGAGLAVYDHGVKVEQQKRRRQQS